MDLVKESLLKAVVATALVLSIGILAGMQMDGERYNYLEDSIQESNLRGETFPVTQEYLEQSSRNYCRIMQEQIPEMAEENANIGRDLQSFTGRTMTRESDFKYIKKHYYVNQLRLYNMVGDYEDRCGENLTRIFFFFDNSVQSRRQGAVLTEYRRDYDNRTYVFSYNLNSKNSTVMDLLKTDYGVEEGPALVLNGNETFRRYVSLEELRGLTE